MILEKKKFNSALLKLNKRIIKKMIIEKKELY